ncbi:tetratricopeptide repeat protein [Chitinophaga sp. Cy-1792]|uniref:tetratricopeptide repeat protein n=1 Tax=Chitinophaga sp. Cy-1792 TaxID=2608339 RepID=UPI0014208D87|nr:tetratricopeptide repeat protein [Chitinophaga sp. Cy-1792]NIG52351.1 tetratricopeptide repeat protein [Chitinophaga sp. Cy-1792]
MEQTKELSDILELAREVVVELQHGSIDIDHIFLAMLRTENAATRYISVIEQEGWTTYVKGESKYGKGPRSVLKMTPATERVIAHAQAFADSRREPAGVMGILLAILAFKNGVRTELAFEGCTFNKTLHDHYGADVVWPKLPVELMPSAVIAQVDDPSRERETEKIAFIASKASLYLEYNLNKEVLEICAALAYSTEEHPGIACLKATALLNLREYEASKPLLDRLAENDLYRRWVENQRLRIEKAGGNYNNAIAACVKNRDFETDAILQNNVGYYLLKQQRYEVALVYLESAIELNPFFAYPYNNLGYVQHKLGKTEAGIENIMYSLELNRSNSYAYKHLGIIYIDLGDIPKAKEYLLIALAYDYTEHYGNEVVELLETI